MTRRYSVALTASAQKDLEDIYLYIAQDSPLAAIKFICELEERIQNLETLPERHPLIRENQFFGTDYRHLVHKDYRVIYRVAECNVFVARVFHGAKLLEL